MAQMYLNLSIICFFLSAACFIVTIVIFFSLHILETIRKIRGQSQMKWIMSKDKRKGRSESSGSKKESRAGYRDLEEEAPTTLLNGEVKRETLVGYYEEKTALADEEWERTELADTEKTTFADANEKEDRTELADADEEKTELADADGENAELTDAGEFHIIESILLVHTDEVI